jgi:hypothetical protein
VLFAEPVPALVPGNLVKHAGCTVTVEDSPALAEALKRRGVPATAL